MTSIFIKINDKDKKEILRHIKRIQKYRSLTHFILVSMQDRIFEDNREQWRTNATKIGGGDLCRGR